MKALDAMAGLAPLALKFCILTAVRSGEVRGARWSELSFDGAAALWLIPGERMKGKKSFDVHPHRVPLSPASLVVLTRAYAVATGAEAKITDLPRLAPLAIAFSEVLPGDLDSDPRPWMGKIRDGVKDHRA